jgi:hypothetical protein
MTKVITGIYPVNTFQRQSSRFPIAAAEKITRREDLPSYRERGPMASLMDRASLIERGNQQLTGGLI